MQYQIFLEMAKSKWGKQAAGLLLVRTDGKIFLARRSSNVMSGTNKLAIPGGKVDEGEIPQESARREFVEEIGSLPKGKMAPFYHVYEEEMNPGDIFRLGRGRIETVGSEGDVFRYYTYFYVTDDMDWKSSGASKESEWETADSAWIDFKEALRKPDVWQPVKDTLKANASKIKGLFKNG